MELTEAEGKLRQINSASALWQRSKSEVTPEEYKEVYTTVSGQYDEPAMTVHYRAEGRQSYAVLLFVPTRAAVRSVRRRTAKAASSSTCAASSSPTMPNCMPSYLRFVRGVIDSEDIPLNISREMLQNNPLVAQIRRTVTARILTELERLAEKEPEKFEPIWDAFGTVIKEGLYEDFERRDQLLKLARFRTTSGSGWRSLKDYVAAMRPEQTEIYYLTGESLDRLKASPQLESATARGVEVLLLADPVDSFWTSMPFKFEDKSLKSLSQGEVDLSSVPLTSELACAPTMKRISAPYSRPSKPHSAMR